MINWKCSPQSHFCSFVILQCHVPVVDSHDNRPLGRYFECLPDFGLFAPIQRVTLVQRRVSLDVERRRPDLHPHTADEDGYY